MYEKVCDKNGDSNAPSLLTHWKTIKLGTGLKDDKDFHAALQANNCQYLDDAGELMATPDFRDSISADEKSVDLCIASTRDIIHRSGGVLEIYKGIKALGGQLLPAEAGPQLRLQYPDQPLDELLLIAMPTIGKEEGLFYIIHEADALRLNTCDALTICFPSACLWVFVIPS